MHMYIQNNPLYGDFWHCKIFFKERATFIKNKERVIKPIVDQFLNTQPICIFDSLCNRTDMKILLDNYFC